MATSTHVPSSRKRGPTLYVALYHGIDALRRKKRHEAGLMNHENLYRFHHATKLGFGVLFAVDAQRSADFASFVTMLFGFDLLHVWSNRGWYGRDIEYFA
ncbi:MAG: hypothetical protein ABI858_09705 [Pseudoxanthomonas sp.]